MIIRIGKTFPIFGAECVRSGQNVLGAVIKECLGNVDHEGKEGSLSSASFEQNFGCLPVCQ